ncbi:MAG: hypothetical protein EKK29_13800 [Hyphomicrobiales bacterium]|nr:MAG: hypothetical protein EKK29_13800 [Hyphomicrobiales bacterium]
MSGGALFGLSRIAKNLLGLFVGKSEILLDQHSYVAEVKAIVRVAPNPARTKRQVFERVKKLRVVPDLHGCDLPSGAIFRLRKPIRLIVRHSVDVRVIEKAVEGFAMLVDRALQVLADHWKNPSAKLLLRGLLQIGHSNKYALINLFVNNTSLCFCSRKSTLYVVFLYHYFVDLFQNLACLARINPLATGSFRDAFVSVRVIFLHCAAPASLRTASSAPGGTRRGSG